MTRWFIQRVKPRFPELFRLPPRSWNCGADQGWRGMAGGDSRLRGRVWGPGSAEAGRSRQRIWALFPPKFRPKHVCLAPPPPFLLQHPPPRCSTRAGLGYPQVPQGTPAPGLRRRSLLSATAWVSCGRVCWTAGQPHLGELGHAVQPPQGPVSNSGGPDACPGTAAVRTC